MDILVENLRYLLWRERDRLPRAQWATQLAQWANCTLDRANSMLRQGRLTHVELEEIAESLHMPVEELASARLLQVDGVDVLKENLLHLLSELPWGGPRRLAKALDISPSTVSQWGKPGKTRPKGERLEQLRDYFGLARIRDLTDVPLFLELEPSTVQSRKEWLKTRIDELPEESVQELFPALQRLLEERP